MATLKRVYKGGKKAAEKKSKETLVNALYKAYGGRKSSLAKKGYKLVSKSKFTNRKTLKRVGKRISGSNKRKFGIDVERPKDITDINKIIRAKIDKFKTFDPIKKLVVDSRYLIALSNTPAWKKDMRGQIMAIRVRARGEYCRTVRAANKRLKDLKIHHVLFSQICKL